MAYAVRCGRPDKENRRWDDGDTANRTERALGRGSRRSLAEILAKPCDRYQYGQGQLRSSWARCSWQEFSQLPDRVDLVRRLAAIVQFPMPVRVGIRRVKNGPLEKTIHCKVLPAARFDSRGVSLMPSYYTEGDRRADFREYAHARFLIGFSPTM